MLGALLATTGPAFAGDTVADFNLRDIKGNTVSLSDFEGKVVLVDFWATWCGPCKDELPHIQRMYDDLGDQGFVVLAITTDDARTKSQVKPFVRRSGYTFPVLYDTDSSVLVVHNPTKTLPFSVVIDRQGQIASKHAGYNPGDEVALRAEIEALLAAGAEPEPAPEPQPARRRLRRRRTSAR